MKKLILSAVLAVSGLASAATWDIDSAHTTAGFTAKHLGITNVNGTLGTVSGKFNVDEKDVTKSTIEATIDVKGINTNMAKRDDHLKSPDFFDSKKFPKMTFKSTKAERKATGGYALTGDLTIRDKTKSITLDVDPLTPELKDPWGGTHRGTHASAKINRTDFDLKWNKALESGGVVVAEEVTLDLEIELLKKADKK